jgi:cobalamin biosynthesis protein CobT
MSEIINNNKINKNEDDSHDELQHTSNNENENENENEDQDQDDDEDEDDGSGEVPQNQSRNRIIDNLIISYGVIEQQKTNLAEYYEDKFNVDDITEKLNEVLRCIERKLKKECKHNYVNDVIDLDPEESVEITYCNQCFCTFAKRYVPSLIERSKAALEAQKNKKNDTL